MNDAKTYEELVADLPKIRAELMELLEIARQNKERE